MVRLIATVEFALPEGLLFEAPSEDKFSEVERGLFNFSIENFDLRIWLRHRASYSRKLKDAPLGVTSGTYVRVEVSRDEPDHPPARLAEVAGTAETAPLSEYALHKQQHYGGIAAAGVRRLLAYFRYEAGNPLLGADVRLPAQVFANPTLTLAEGEVVWDRTSTAVAEEFACVREYPRWDIKPFRAGNEEQLERYLANEPTVALHDEIRAEARDAIARGDLRRAIVDLAVAAELAIKALLLRESPAADMWTHFEQQGRLRIGVILMLEAAEQIYSTPFGHMGDLKNLFMCRNQIVHHGKKRYRQNSGPWKFADRTVLASWWNAVSALVAWLNSLEHADR